MNAPAPTPRLERVPFSRPVRVTPIEGGSQPSLRLIGGNLSRSGMFLRSPLLLEPGTKVALALEAKGQSLPFAEGEVIWQREPAKASDGAHPGFGIKFTNFLHARAPELVDALVTRGMEKLAQPPSPETQTQEQPRMDVAVGPQTPSKKDLESFAAPPEKFTELSLQDEAPAPVIEDREPAFLKGGKKLVVDVEEPKGIPEVEIDELDELPHPNAFKPTIGKILGTGAFALLILVPMVVAIGTWKASKTDEPAVAVQKAAQQEALAQAETRVVEFPAPAPKVEVQAPVVVAPEVQPEVKPETTELAPLVAEQVTPPVEMKETVAEKSPTPVNVVATKTQLAPKPVVAPSSSVSLGIAAVNSLSAKVNSGVLELSLQLGSGASIRRAFALKAPNRLVIDVGGPTPTHSSAVENTKISSVQKIRIGAQPEGARLVLDLGKSASNVKVSGSRITAELK